MTNSSERSVWATRLGFILASAGSAVGLGAIWKFPYMAGTNGGSAFILPYIVLTIAIGFVVLMIEMALGRASRGGAAHALRLFGGRFWGGVGKISVLTGFLILAFYQVIGGWCLNYLWDACLGNGLITDTAQLGAYFNSFVSDGARAVFMQIAFLALTAGVIAFGVEAGIERISKILMPTLFILMLFLIVRGLTLPNAWLGVEYMFKFDPQSFNGTSLLNAMGFAFFSLSLGSGSMMNYGSYLPNSVNLPSSVAWISFLAILASILGGLMIMPAVFAFNLDPAAGPGLTFVTMPAVFAQLPFGQGFAILFYICLVVAALTSAISIMEMSVQFLVDEYQFSRGASITINTFALTVLGVICALSFGLLSDCTVAGKTFFDWLDFLTSNVGMPIGAMGIAIVGGYLVWPVMKKQLTLTQPMNDIVLNITHFLIRFIVPCVIIVIAGAGLLG